MEEKEVDIKENYIYQLDDKLLEILLKDRSSNKQTIIRRVEVVIIRLTI